MLMLFCYLLTNRKINVSLINLKVAEENAESWEEFDYRDTTITYDYFVNANQWHYDINRVMDIACIVSDYSKKKMLNEENWKLKCMHIRSTEDDRYISSAFVCSEAEEELYVFSKVGGEEGNKYLIIADIVKGNGLPILLENGTYSYDSSLSWRAYGDGLNINEKGKYSIIISENAYIYDPIYIDEGVCAMMDYLSCVQYDKGNNWKLLEDMIYIGENGYLTDMWFSDGIQKVHIVIDVWNKLYTVVEVI